MFYNIYHGISYQNTTEKTYLFLYYKKIKYIFITDSQLNE